MKAAQHDGSDEMALSEEVSEAHLMRHARKIARWIRLSGSREEREAFLYLKGELEALDLEPTLYDHPAYISLPVSASLTIVAPRREEIACITHSAGASTGPDGVEGDVMYAGAGVPADFAGRDVRGKIALADGMAMPVKVKAAEDAGAAAQIHVNDANFHEMIVSSVWGNPTLRNIHEWPRTPIISVRQPDGDRLKAALGSGRLRAKVTARVDTGWRTTPLLVADIPGVDAGGPFVLLSGHVDSWHYGAMDNGTANATMLEVARILTGHRDRLRRGVRLAFWSGHSHGRYSGSAWYADTHWEELHARCVAHVNVESPGAVGATVLAEAACMAEARGLAADVIRRVAAQEYDGARPSRAGDQSFWGLGIPSVFMGVSRQPAPKGDSAAAQAHALLHGRRPVKSGGLGWWWHTTDDTLDKIDSRNLARDCRVYVSAVFRLCASAVLPFDYTALTQEYVQTLTELQESAKGRFTLEEAIARARALERRLRRLNDSIHAGAMNEDAEDRNKTMTARANRCLMRLGRCLIPPDYCSVGPFEHDPALPVPPFPRLNVIRAMAAMDPAGDDFNLAAVEARRGYNQVLHALQCALDEVEVCLA